MRIIFFSPHEGIWVHAFPEALLAESLKKQGHEVYFITCDRIFNEYCITMSALGIQPDASVEKKDEVCFVCNKRRDLIINEFSFSNNSIQNFTDQEEIDKIRTFIKSSSQKDLIDFTEDGVSIGKISSYELLLKFKKNSLEFNSDEEKYFMVAFFNSLLSKRASDKWIQSLNPDVVIIYNTNYAVNRSVTLNCLQKNIPVYSIHAGDIFSDRLSRLMIAQDNLIKNCYDIKLEFENKTEDNLFTLETIQEYLEHQRTLLAGKHFLVYSSGIDSTAKSIKDFFGIKKEQKLLVATMSSYDEMFASIACGFVKFKNKSIFKNQIQWLRELIEFIKTREDFFLVIRVHPREYPNKRESYSSSHGEEVKTYLSDLPKNCKLNTPDDNISLYSLALETDLFLNAWSSAGEEMALFGVPVLLYDDEMILYPSSINYLGNSKEDYFEKITLLSERKISREELLLSLKWISFKLNFTTFSIEESYSEKPIKVRNISLLEKFRKTYTMWSNRNLSQEQVNLNLRAKKLKITPYLEMLFRRKKENLFQIDEYRKSFKAQDPNDILNEYIVSFYKLISENFTNEVFSSSLLKKRWDVLIQESK